MGMSLAAAAWVTALSSTPLSFANRRHLASAFGTTETYAMASTRADAISESTAADASAKPPSRWAVRVTRPFLQRPTAVEVLPTSTTANVRRRSIPG